MQKEEYLKLEITSSAFKNDSLMPQEYTGYGYDYSPELKLHNISEEGKSIAIIMDDLDIPMLKEYNHWLIWNIPITDTIPKGIPFGEEVVILSGAKQGIGYGKHQYRGPKPPKFIRNTHRYKFNVFILNCFLDIPVTSKKRDLLNAMEGKIVQYGFITGLYKN